MNSDISPRVISPTMKIYRFKVSLKEHKPLIWRRIEVPGDFVFAQLAKIIIRAMGWKGYHLYAFRTQFIEILEPHEDYEDHDDVMDAFSVKVSDEFALLPTAGPKSMTFEYDFGDRWEHKVVLEDVFSPVADKLYPACISGKNACPPEDCGSVEGYADVLKILKNPAHKEHQEMKDWLDSRGYEKEFDPKKFDLAVVNFN